MVQPKARAPQHSLAKQVLAVTLSFATIAGVLPPAALSAPLPAPSRARDLHPLPAAIPATPPLPEPQPGSPASNKRLSPEESRKWGEITVGQPKIWQYERINSLLDGLLRDVQGVSMSDLLALNPNATNGAAVKFVQSMLEIGAQYNQAADVTNKIALQNYATSQSLAATQLQANSAYLQQLYGQRTDINSQLLLAMQEDAGLQTQLATTQLDPTSDAYKALAAREQAAANKVKSLQADISSINSQITSANSTTLPAAPTLTPTTAPTAPESANEFSSFLGNLPPDLTKNIVSQLQSPSFPATKQLDSFITLLYERLAREISVLQDDVMRDTDNVSFLVQFDVGLYPGIQARDHVGMVEFSMHCDSCKVYSIYPGQSSYNLANYEGTSKRYSLWGALSTIIGFGISADYRRQTDTLHSELIQSVYISGFQDGAPGKDRAGDEHGATQRFGWYFGGSPFESLVTPGIRSTFAIISVPARLVKACQEKVERQGMQEWQEKGEMNKNKKTSEKQETSDGNLEVQGDSCEGGLLGKPDGNGAVNVALDLEVHSDWVRRDDPFYQQKDKLPNSLPSTFRSALSWFGGRPFNYASSDRIQNSKTLAVTLPGTESLKEIPNVVLGERNRLHVLGMEYNPVYYTLPTQPTTLPGTSTLPAAPPPGTATASASSTGTGTTTVTVSGAGTASATSSGAANTAATASAASPQTTAAMNPSTTPTPDPLTGCKQDQCAAVLVKLAEPIDPNLVVTVWGLPLRRVRDWRGRATSVLPPAQSASDLTSPATLIAPGPTTSLGKPIGAENATSASLFEVDAPGPDTWMEVDSHRILLNISRTLAGDRNAFPSIQIVDPARRALFVPLELDTGFSELIMNGFHFPTRNKTQLEEYLCNHLREDLVPCLDQVRIVDRTPSDANLAHAESERHPARKALVRAPGFGDTSAFDISVDSEHSDAVATPSSGFHPAGPYAYETFLPLFLPRRDPQPIYAYLGETGVQILIGLEKTIHDPSSPVPKPKSWLAGRTQVVLEDRYLDLAWSLSCSPQSPNTMLVCDVPTGEIRDAYKIVTDVCKQGLGCPSLPNPKPLKDSTSLSSLQVWVDQYDPEGADSFYSATPAVIGRFPVAISNKNDHPDVGFRPWYFESATPDWVKLTGCHYPEFPGYKKLEASQVVTILGRGIPEDFRSQALQSGAESGCKWFLIPTLALTYDDVVIEYPYKQQDLMLSANPPLTPFRAPAGDPCTIRTAPLCSPESISTALFQPDFGAPEVIPHLPPIVGAGKAPVPDSWTLNLLARRVDCNDVLDLLNEANHISAIWRIGAFEFSVRGLSSTVTAPCDKQVRDAAVDRANSDMAKAQSAQKTAKSSEERASAAAQVEAAIASEKNISSGVAELPNWDEASKNDQLLLEVSISRSDLDKLPLKTPARVLRGPLLSRVGTLPDLRSAILPTTLKVVTVGPNQFALQGSNAGVIDAVNVQGPDGVINLIPVVAGGQNAFVTLPDAAKPKPSTPSRPTINAFSKDSAPGGTKIEIQGTNFGTTPGKIAFGKVNAVVSKNCWTDTSITLDIPRAAPPGAVDLTITISANGTTSTTTSKFTVADKPLDRSEPTSCPATNPPSSDGQAGGKSAGPKAGGYTIVPLIALLMDKTGKVQRYLPLDVTDSNGKPLAFTVAEQKNDNASTPKGVDSPTTTVTISKKTTVTPATTNSNPPPNQ